MPLESIQCVEQRASAGNDFDGSLPTTTPTDPDDQPLVRVYPADAQGGQVYPGYEHRKVQDVEYGPEPNAETLDKLAFYEIQQIIMQSSAAFDVDLILTNGTDEVLWLQQTSVTDFVQTNNVELYPGWWLKVVTTGATDEVLLRATFQRSS